MIKELEGSYLLRPTRKGGDIDILVKDENLKDFKEKLSQEGFINCGTRYLQTGFIRIFPKLDMIDLKQKGLSHNGIVYLPGHYFFEKKYSKKLIQIVSILVHLIIDKDINSYRWKILERDYSLLSDREKGTLKEILSREYGKLSEKIESFLIKRDTYQLNYIKWKIIFKKINFYQTLKMPFILINNQLYKKKKQKKKIKIAFLGVDGSGKTTSIKNLSEFLESNNISTINSRMGVYHQRTLFGIFLMNVYKNFKTQDTLSVTTLNNNYKRFGLLKNIYRMIDMFLRHIKVLNYARVNKKKVILFDRYFYDIILQSKLDFLTKMLLKIVPKPDFLFYLKVDPKIAHKRRGQRDVQALAEQMDKFEEEIKDIFKPIILIPKSEDDTLREILLNLNCRRFLCKIV